MGPTPGRIDDDLDTVDALDDVEERDDAVVEIEVTRARIEQTRADMTETIDAIKDKLSPQNLVQQAKETVREATIGRAQEMASNVVDSAKQAANTAVEGAERVMSSASSGVRDAGETVVESIQRNPLPFALIATGLGWLWMNSRRQSWDTQTFRTQRLDAGYPRRYDNTYSARYGTQTEFVQQPSDHSGIKQTLRDAQESVGDMAGQVQERAGQVIDRVQDRASDMGAAVQYQAQRAGDVYERWMQENPLAVGAMALAVGAAVGMAIPETPQERRLMGEARDRLVDRAQEVTQDVAQKVQSVAHEAMDTVREEARGQGLTS